MSHKTEVFEIFKQHVSRSKFMMGYKLKHIRTDNGMEFNYTYFFDFCKISEVYEEFTNFYTPEQNEVCEKASQTILNYVPTILTYSRMLAKFWPDAAIYYDYSWNRLCHHGQKITSVKFSSGKKPFVCHLRPFKSLVYIDISK